MEFLDKVKKIASDVATVSSKQGKKIYSIAKLNLEIVEKLKVIAAAHGKTVPATAIRFILDNIKDSVVIAGVKNEKQMLSNLDALDWHLTKEEIDILNEVSL